MDNSFKIYIDRLKEGQTEKICETMPPDFLEINESELKFQEPVTIAGEVYLADEHLVFHLHITTSALMPCSICNATVKINIQIQDFYHTEPLSEMKGPIFDYLEPLREAILLQVPAYAECGDNCPERKTLSKYLKSESQDSTHQSFPFSDL